MTTGNYAMHPIKAVRTSTFKSGVIQENVYVRETKLFYVDEEGNKYRKSSFSAPGATHPHHIKIVEKFGTDGDLMPWEEE